MENINFYEQDGVVLKYTAKVPQYYVSDFGPVLKMRKDEGGESHRVDPSIVYFFPIEL